MNIGRHNYEEYFILYMDNELGADERRAVETFVQQHPDLKDELDSLLQYKLVPDTNIVFNGKQELMKANGNTPITLSNYEEWMVLHMDNELSADQKNKVEQFLVANPLLEKEFSLLQQTKLQPETILFAGKTSLYRKEEKVRPVYWWRIAAAAILLFGIGITTAIVISNNKKVSPGTETAKTNIEPVKTTTQYPVIIPVKPNESVKENVAAENEKQAPVEKQLTPTINKQDLAVQQNNKPEKEQPVQIDQQNKKEETVVAVVKTNGNDLPKPLNNPNIKNDVATNATFENNIPSEVRNVPLTNSNVTSNNSQPSNNVVYASNSNNGDAGIDQADSKKNKNRGIFRKIARTFEKRTGIDPADDNRLLVGGLSIKLK